MYRFQEDLDLNDIIGETLDQICMGAFDIQFVFGQRIRITVQSRVSILDNNEIVAIWNDGENWTDLSFQRLLNLSVQSYKVIDDRTLEFRFSDELQLQFHDNSDRYECLQIYRKGDSGGPVVI